MENTSVQTDEHAEQLEMQQKMDEVVHQALVSDELITKSVHKYVSPDTLKEKISDAITFFSGSWTFIFALIVLIFGWMFLMTVYDPFPYILLNLVISVVCVLQSPFILMSNWRKEAMDDDRDQQSYAINLKNEVQITQILKQQAELLELIKKGK